MRLERHFELKRACGPPPPQVWGRACGLGRFCGRSKTSSSGNHAAVSTVAAKLGVLDSKRKQTPAFYKVKSASQVLGPGPGEECLLGVGLQEGTPGVIRKEISLVGK